MIVSVTSRNSIRVRTRLTVYGTISVTHRYAGTGAATRTQGVWRHVWHAWTSPSDATNAAPNAARSPTARTRIGVDLPWLCSSMENRLGKMIANLGPRSS